MHFELFLGTKWKFGDSWNVWADGVPNFYPWFPIIARDQVFKLFIPNHMVKF